MNKILETLQDWFYIIEPLTGFFMKLSIMVLCLTASYGIYKYTSLLSLWGL